jgi:hypothetical protein
MYSTVCSNCTNLVDSGESTRNPIIQKYIHRKNHLNFLIAFLYRFNKAKKLRSTTHNFFLFLNMSIWDFYCLK